MINFPDSPTTNQVFTTAGSSWRWDSTKWIAYSASIAGDITSVNVGTGLSGGGTSGDVTVSLTTPVSVANGGTGATSLPMQAGPGGFGLAATYLQSNSTAVSTIQGGNGVVGTWGDNRSVVCIGVGNTGMFECARVNGTMAAPTALNNGDLFGQIAFEGYGATAWNTNPAAFMRVWATENWTNTANGSKFTWETQPNGTAGTGTRTTTMTLGQALTIGNPNAGWWPLNDTTSFGFGCLALGGSANGGWFAIDNYGGTEIYGQVSQGAPWLVLRSYRGTLAAPSPVLSGDNLGSLQYGGTWGTAVGNAVAQIQINGVATENWSSTNRGGRLDFQTTPNGSTTKATTMTLSGGGILGIGTASTGTGTTQRLAVVGNATAGQVCASIATGPAGSDTTSYLLAFQDATVSLGFLGAITRNGSGTVAYGTSSDVRLKENLQESEIGLDALLQLKVYDYTWKSTGEATHGLVAQEVQAHYPWAVRQGGDDPLTDPWLIEHGRLTPLLVRAVQQLSAEVQELTARLANLEGGQHGKG